MRWLAMLAVVVAGAASIARGTSFVDEVNLTSGQVGDYFHEAENAAVFDEYFGGGWHRAYWAVTASHTWGSITYRYELPFEISEASLTTAIYCHHGYDPLAEGRIEISPDGVEWTTLHTVTPYVPPGDQGGAGGHTLIGDILAGSSTAYIRAWLYQEMSVSGSFQPIQFNRCAPGDPGYNHHRFQAIDESELLGDMNGDCIVNGLDVYAFVDAVVNGPYSLEADLNLDGMIDGLDVAPFVAAVIAGNSQPVPEPSTLTLGTLTLLGLLGWRRKGR